MSQFELMMVLKIAVAPMALSFGLALGIGAILRKKGSEGSDHAIWPGLVAIVVAMLAGQFLYFDVKVPDRVALVEGWQWLMLFAMASLLTVFTAFLPKGRRRVGEVTRVVLFAGVIIMSVRALAAMERSTALAWMIGAPLVCGAWSVSLASCGEKLAGRLWPGVLAIVCTISAITLFLLHSLTHFIMAGALAAALGGVFISQLALRKQPGLVASAGGNFPLLMLAGLFVVHVLYLDDVPIHTLVILMAAPWGVLASLSPGIRGRSRVVVGVVQIVIVVGIAAAAFLPVALNYEPDPYAGY